MIKKLIVVAVVGGLAVAAVSKSRIGSYLRTEWKCLREAAEEQIPPEKEIARLRDEVSRIDTDIKKVVKEQVKLEQERDELIAKKKLLEKNLPGMRDRLNSRAAMVRSAEQQEKAGEKGVTLQFSPDDRAVSVPAAKMKLEGWVQELAASEKELKVLDQKIDSLNRIIGKLEEKRLAMTRAKDELERSIDELQEELLALQIQQMESKYQTDDTRTAQIKESIAKLRKRMDLQRRELAKLQGTGAEAATKSVDEIMAPVSKPDGLATTSPPSMPKAND
ncbi:MAG TPA: hypothetical protein VKE74_14380 [Gemmataceae bacterium]|nr:hypothetical protein [Gemmataceae bacterium]